MAEKSNHQHQVPGMGKRGATRPMTLHTGGHDHGPPYSDSRYHMLRMHHSHTLWIYWLLVMLGI